MLKFKNEWRFKSPGEIPPKVDEEFSQIIKKIAKGEHDVLEHFKKYFGSVCGKSPSRSSNASWAASDLDNYMTEATQNPALFIEAFYDGWNALGENYPKIHLPFVNEVLKIYNTRFQIDNGELIYDGLPVTASPKIPNSFLEDAKDIIGESLQDGDRLLAEGRYRQAVQEMLWLLETLVTAFDGKEVNGKKIDGKYFNEIIKKLRKSELGTTFGQVIIWVTTLHGYLSAPSGGGIRHGLHLQDGDLTTENEARLYYNLIKSYIAYFLAEYEKFYGKGTEEDKLFY